MKHIILFIMFYGVAQTALAGFGFSEPGIVNSNWQGDSLNRQPQIATDGNGLWMCVFWSDDDLDGTGSDIDNYYSISTDDGLTWSDMALLNTNGKTDSGHDILILGSLRYAPGMFLVVWYTRDSFGGTIGTDADIAYAIYDIQSGTWSDPKIINHYASNDTALDARPTVDTDGAGTWVCVWGSRYEFGGIKGSDYDVAWSRSIDDGQSWSDAQLINPRAGEDDTDDFQFPMVRTNGTGVWITVWQSQEDPDGIWGDDYDIMYSRSTDNGATWGATEALNINAGGDSGDDAPFSSAGGFGAGNVSLDTDQRGTWLVTWSSTEDLNGKIGTDWDILIARSTDDGAT